MSKRIDAMESQILDLRKSGMKVSDISFELGISPFSIYTRLAKAGLAKRENYRTEASIRMDSKIRRLMGAGMLSIEIASEVGISVDALYQRVRRMGLSAERRAKSGKKWTPYGSLPDEG